LIGVFLNCLPAPFFLSHLPAMPPVRATAPSPRQAPPRMHASVAGPGFERPLRRTLNPHGGDKFPDLAKTNNTS
jgi:hypothetical protein